MFFVQCGQWFVGLAAYGLQKPLLCTDAWPALVQQQPCARKSEVFIWWGTQTRSPFVGVDNFVFTVIHVSGAACFIVSLNALETRAPCRYRCLRDVSLCYAHLKRVVLDLQAPKRCPRLFFWRSCRLHTVNYEFWRGVCCTANCELWTTETELWIVDTEFLSAEL